MNLYSVWPILYLKSLLCNQVLTVKFSALFWYKKNIYLYDSMTVPYCK